MLLFSRLLRVSYRPESGRQPLPRGMSLCSTSISIRSESLVKTSSSDQVGVRPPLGQGWEQRYWSPSRTRRKGARVQNQQGSWRISASRGLTQSDIELMGCVRSEDVQLFEPETELQKQLFREYAPFDRLECSVNVNLKYTHLYEVDTKRTLGEGVRQTFSYTCYCHEEELKKERKIFWETRNHGNPAVWGAFAQAVRAKSNGEAVGILLLAEVKLISKRITLAIDKKGIRYEIPIFIINDPPVFGKTSLAERNLATNFAAETVEVLIRSTRAEDKRLEVSTRLAVPELKEQWLRQTGLRGKVRLFLGGRELLDQYVLGNFKVVKGSVIQANLLSS